MEKNTGKLFTPVHGTPMDYLRWRGDLTFRQDSFNEVDNLVLCIISYINFRRITSVHTTEPSAAPTLAQVAPLLTEEDDQLGLSELSYLPLVQLAAKTPRFRGVRLFAYTHEYDEAQAKQFDAVSFGWSHMTYSAEEGAKLSTVKDDSSGFYIPAGYADVVPALREAGVELKLNVFMANAPLRTMLADESSRAAAVTKIMAELGRVYPDLGYNPYSGVTIDFEGLRAADKESFNAFMTELSAALHAEDKTLYAAVMPAVYGDAYFDGYDFKTLGTLCDRVILMAHDYAASDLTGFLGSRYYRNQPCAPLYKVYYAVRTAAREMDDPAKLTLAVSMDARAWQTDADGLLTAVRSTHPLQTTVYKRLCQSDTVMGWSDTARSPWGTYSTESGQHIFLWYEDARSTAEKLSCARLVGVTSVSVWRLGLIPDYADEGLHYDVMSVL